MLHILLDAIAVYLHIAFGCHKIYIIYILLNIYTSNFAL